MEDIVPRHCYSLPALINAGTDMLFPAGKARAVLDSWTWMIFELQLFDTRVRLSR